MPLNEMTMSKRYGAYAIARLSYPTRPTPGSGTDGMILLRK